MARGKVRVTTTPSPIRQQDGTSPHFITPPDLAAAIAAIFPITPAHGGTGTATVFTPGSIVFASGSGIYAQDNADLFWDNTNKRLGIGTAAPSVTLEVAGDVKLSGLFLDNFFGSHAFAAGGVGGNSLAIVNSTAGVGNFASLTLGTDAINNFTIQGFSSTYTPSGYAFPNGGAIGNAGAGGLSFAQTGTGDIRFYTTGANVLRMKIATGGTVSTTSPLWVNGGTIGALSVSPIGTGFAQGFCVQTAALDAFLEMLYDGTQFKVSATYLNSEGYKPIGLWTHDLERLRVHADGGVSIGNTTSPGLANLSVTGSTASLTFQTTTAIVAPGGGAAPTFATIGGGGPAVAAQNGWLKAIDATGATIWIPVWK